MYSVIISLIVSIAVGTGLWLSRISSHLWAVILGFLAFVVCMFVISMIVRRLVMSASAGLQEILTHGQKRLSSAVNILQTRPVGDPRQATAKIEKIRDDFLREAIAYTSKLEPFKGWALFMEKQINTTRMQFYLQLQNFKKVDELLPKCLFLDAFSNSIRISRLYSRDASVPEIEKVFKKAAAKLRYNKSALLYSLMAWIYIKRKMPEKAHPILTEGCRKNENDVLKRNCEKLANNRFSEFSNAGLGDEWFALGLETPKVQVRRQQPKYSNGRPF